MGVGFGRRDGTLTGEGGNMSTCARKYASHSILGKLGLLACVSM